MNSNQEFHQNIHQLIELLKKIVGHFPSAMNGYASSGVPKGKEESVPFNLILFNFFPVSYEELDEWEEFYDQMTPSEDGLRELRPELSQADLEFLRRHGIRF